jgi:hypothetical protein
VIPWSAVEETLRSAAARSVGAVYVSGRPGGLIRLQGPVVVGTWTTGTPLAIPRPNARSGPGGGSEEPVALDRAAMADAIFVIAAGRIEAVREEAGPSPRVTGELDLERALREVRRRLPHLEREGAYRALCPEVDRVRPRGDNGASPVPATPLTAPERAVLELTAGRHTPRDIAFLLNRGVFGVSLDVMHLLDARLVEIVPDLFEPAPSAPPVPATEQRGTPTVATLLAPRAVAPAAQPSPQPAAGAPPRLAQREPGASGRSRTGWRPWPLRPAQVRRAGREHDDDQ